MSDSWILKAIEDAAERRVMERMSREPALISIFGLQSDQINDLIVFFQRRTGLDPHNLRGKQIYEAELK